MWYFQYPEIYWCQKLFLLNICSAQFGPKIISAHTLLKFGTFGIWNMPISISMSKIIFIKYLPPVRSKLVPKLKVHKIYWNSAHAIFQIWQSQCWCQQWFLLNIYHLLGSNWFKIKYIYILNIFIKFQFLSNHNKFWAFSSWDQFGPSRWQILDKK